MSSEGHRLPDHHLRHAGAAEVHGGVAVDHDDDVGERRDVGPAGRRGPEQAADLRNLARQRHLVVEDPPGAAAPREELDLVGDPRAGGVDEPEDRQLLTQGHLRGPHDLLHRAGAPRAGLDGRVVGDDDRRPAVDGAAPRDDTVGREPGGHRVGVAAVLDERPLVEQQVDPLADVQLVLRGELRGRLRRRRRRRRVGGVEAASYVGHPWVAALGGSGERRRGGGALLLVGHGGGLRGRQVVGGRCRVRRWAGPGRGR